ncbi:L-histidine N(alpha)-methyltransferase [Flammeovirga kamogawensis]|uniref:L-histidine N(Alpha)-methyltransferase n=1 Tax=Flammeovirga kamogawensis TaxID=373891 RepID=A0ABX8GRA8_9BACT|nr:L-histidine N(alpha)-methyltransferase [Flammeovirga kamogawensis]MBB6464017.1 dimethylhistidine N-methyltransferase [Flammeovirga kamogawensis]QWG06105.1 L-histidine N(alpha)-methyltransferase [Flammeovirga kamogawensis]TRX67937.1 L-histidine N(alpha)-methyltransferase [Flammeovirga kamogawensis]
MIIEKTLFAKHVDEGLSSKNKYLSSMYFYDTKGELLFREIMNLKEYYLTNCEMEILSFHGNEIAESLPSQNLDIIELGAGDGIKTKELLKHFDFNSISYCPIDISEQAIRDITSKMKEWLPSLKVNGICGDYFQMISSLKSSNKKLILFLGSNLGNMSDSQASNFIEHLDKVMNIGDSLFIGLDLIKAKEIVLPAYNDNKGITAAFNLNLLERMNRELNANFIIDQFEHYASYSEDTGIAKSYIKSKKNQTVFIEALEQSYEFKEDELIHTEVSRKYDLNIVRQIIKNTSLKLTHQFTDHKQYFTNLILTKS